MFAGMCGIAARLKLVYFDGMLAEALSTITRRLREKHRESALPSFLDRLSADLSSEAITWILLDVPRRYGETTALLRSSAGELHCDALDLLPFARRHIATRRTQPRDTYCSLK
jgi:hypothetical protein